MVDYDPFSRRKYQQTIHKKKCGYCRPRLVTEITNILHGNDSLSTGRVVYATDQGET